MNADQTKQLAIAALEDLKGIDIVSIDVRDMTSITDTLIICTGRSNRHVRSLADSVYVQAKAHKLSYCRMEGEKESEWVIVDLADVIVHVMQPTARQFYNLEDLWQPVKELRQKQS